MAPMNINIPESLKAQVDAEALKTGESLTSVITRALAQYLGSTMHTLFQVSTSGSMVAGVYQAAVTTRVILRHGNFGLGTFENLDGEMVVLDGNVYRVRADGRVDLASPEDSAPFAVVTEFTPSSDFQSQQFGSLRELSALCDDQRPSDNIFYALRLDGEFDTIKTRAVKPPGEGGLIEAAKAQAEFNFTAIRGTLVGLWSPGFSSAFSISGYHFHFLSEDRMHGGHVLDCSSLTVRLRSQALADFHLALPETESFLKADLSKNSAADLAYAEQAH